MDDTTLTYIPPKGILVIDTETNKLPDYTKDADHPDQPRVADFAAIALDASGAVQFEFQRYIKPDGWSMDPGASAINGLTDDFLREQGIPIGIVLDFYQQSIAQGYGIVAYGAQFDCKLMRGELRRAGLDDMFYETRNVCLMREARPFAKSIGREIIKAGGNNRGWPKLDDLCAFLGIERTEKHGGLTDARDTALCFQKMLGLGYQPIFRVHESKNLEQIRSNR